MSSTTPIHGRAEKKGPAFGGAWPMHLGGFAIAAGVSAAAYLGFLAPLIERAEAIRSAEHQLADLERSVESARRNRTAAVGHTAAARAELADVQLQLRPVTDLNRRLDDLVALAIDCGLDIGETAADAPVIGQWYDTVPVRMQGRGQFPDCTRFLHRVRTALPDVDVAAFDLVRNPGDAPDTARFQVDLAWYAVAGSGRRAIDD